MTSINCKGNLISLDTPKIMGILNITPDSFFDGGKNNSILNSLKKTEQMLLEGVHFVDIGGMSSRPGALEISNDEELKRILPILEAILKEFPKTIVSIDTFRSEIAKETINMGASMINDISGGSFDEKMFDTIAELHCPYILMHMRGTFKSMHTKTDYKNVSIEVIQELSKKINELQKRNICDIIIDPGFGFSKNIQQNFTLLKELDILKKIIDLPLLVGISRKSMIWKKLNIEPINSLSATSAMNMVALNNGAKILRVHDVKEAKQVVDLYLALN